MKIGIVIILYHPQESNIHILKCYSGLFDKVYVFDNTEGFHQNKLTICSLYPEYIYLSSNENIGIAKTLNEMARRAIFDGMDRLITMDQDSDWEINQLQNYINCIQLSATYESTVMFGVSYSLMESLDEKTCRPVISDLLITSGSCINLHAFKNLPGFDENLFIDGVDTDFCLAANLHGHKLVAFKNIQMKHTIGQVKKIKLGNSYLSRNIHTPKRVYYMVRNYLYINKKYHDHQQQFKKVLHQQKTDLLNRIKNNILYNAQRISVFKQLLYALYDYKRGKMGKTN